MKFYIACFLRIDVCIQQLSILLFIVSRLIIEIDMPLIIGLSKLLGACRICNEMEIFCNANILLWRILGGFI